MCGRYALGIRASFIRRQLEEHDMPVEDAPDDDDVRQTYNFAPGSHGLVYRADVPDYGAGRTHRHSQGRGDEASDEANDASSLIEDPKETRYKLQAMKWGLVPFWTKRNPDYGSVLRTINARDDSLAANGGMWNTMKKGKRCIVVAQGFYEWLKKNGGKEKIPHYTKRKDGQLMCFAGLWDCVQYEGSDEKNYTYTIITTDSNKQLSFLHDRMPVILDNGSDQIRNWLDPNQSEWSSELQSLLKPYRGELECYPVSKEVGKVGNNSPAFIVPVASTENKSNIANFFSNATKTSKGDETLHESTEEGAQTDLASEEKAITSGQNSTGDNVPPSVPASTSRNMSELKRKREVNRSPHGDDPNRTDASMAKAQAHAPRTASPPKTPAKKLRSATSNGTRGSPTKTGDGSQRITRFFNK